MAKLKKDQIIFLTSTPLTTSHDWLKKYFLSETKEFSSLEKNRNMTYEELLHHLDTTYGLKDNWPKTFEVDAATYGNVCQGILVRRLRLKLMDIDFEGYTFDGTAFINIAVGKHGGVKFKNIELILKP